MQTPTQKMIYSMLSGYAITYHPDLARKIGVPEAIILGQLLYWSGKAKSDWLYKTVAELEEETALSKHRQLRALRSLEDRGLVRSSLRGIPRKRHLQVDDQAVFRLAVGTDSGHSSGRFPADNMAEKRSAITESSSEIESTQRREAGKP